MSSSSSSSPAAAAKICFNSQCKEPKSDPPPRRKGWRLRSGDHAELCDRCSCTYEQGNFCETFHTDASGWRKCESCGKRVHCGCIVSASAYLLLDAGGVECIACARKGLAMAPNQMWSPLLLSAQVSERPKEFPLKSWNQMTGAYPGQWRQAAHMWNNTSAQSDLHQRLSYEFDRPMHGGRSSISMQEKKIENLPERTVSSSLNHMRYANGTTGPEQASAFNMYHKDETSTDAFPDSGQLLSDNDLMSTRKAMNSDPCSTSSGFNLEPHASLCTMGQSSSVLKGDASSLLIGLAAPFASLNGANDLSRISSTTQMQRQMPPPLPKQLHPSSQNMADSCGELQTQMRNGRPRAEARARTQLLPRYWPRITDQELQQISGDSNSVITPLFEKMLSASDAGRIGRLVLPKKCAEAYFPPISHPEGLPLKVQDATGKEWIFQFRFWPNNNSRMYVLEGVTPCIQSMQLQAGDTVTFSRIDPEGKLVMGFRKASNISIEQDFRKTKTRYVFSTPQEVDDENDDSQTTKAGNGFSAPQEVNNKNTVADFAGNLPVHPPKRDTELGNSINAEDQSVVWSKFDKAGFIQKEVSATKSSQALNKRKGSILGSKNKRLRIENEDSIELKLSWEEAQGLLRPPPNGVPSVVVIDGHEFEEYEEAPVLGKPTIFTTKQTGEKHQWAQCDDCSKWRKLPVDALLPSTWTCADNRWDPERCSCSSSQETSMELADILPSKSGPSKRSKIKVEDSNIEVSDGLDTLANLAILGEGEALPASAQAATTKHPRHRPGCTCIVCIQPPSGKGPKHKQTCTCNVCLTVKRRFRTLMLRREKRQSEKDAETAALKQQKQLAQSSEMLPQLEANSPITGKNIVGSLPQTPLGNNEVVLVDDESERRKTMPSPIKTQIDLNIQPEREEEPSPVSDAGKVVRPFRDATS